MDILRKELEEIYASQELGAETLPTATIADAREKAEGFVSVTRGCAVVTDAATDKCYVYLCPGGVLALPAAQGSQGPAFLEVDSSDEDLIYERIHPEDLVDKRLLEYEFFMFVDPLPPAEKTSVVAKCVIRMKDATGVYRLIDNTTQLVRLSPRGKIWLILCTYSLSTLHAPSGGINPCLINTATGEVNAFEFDSRRQNILTQREKQILMLIRDGVPSKLIADSLGISIHTVNRHRQNILQKLSVGNSIEAVTAAIVMKLI